MTRAIRAGASPRALAAVGFGGEYRCRGMRTLVDLRIEGEVMDDLGDALGTDGRQGDFAPMPSALSFRRPCTRDVT